MSRVIKLSLLGWPHLATIFLLLIVVGCAMTSDGGQASNEKPHQVVRTTGIQDLAPDEQSPIQRTGINTGDIEPMVQKIVRSILSAPAVRTLAVSAPNDPVRVQGVPRVVLRPVMNMTSERFDPEIITARIRNGLIMNANGQLEFIYRELGATDAGINEAIQAEQLLRDTGIVDAGPDLRQKSADFFLMGEIREHTTVTASGRDRLLVFSFYLVNTETSSMVWADEYQIRRAALLSTSYRGIDE